MAFYLSTHRVEVAMLGDSITAQMAPRQGGFPFPFNSAANLGVGGNTAAQIASRVGSISATATHVVIQAGTNDLVGLGTAVGVIPNYTSMLNAIPSTTTVIVIGILPVDEVAELAFNPTYPPFLNNALIKIQNIEISKLCRTYSNCVVATGIMDKIMTGKTVDGIHPTAAADLEIINALMPLLGL
jgi:lysophospholipase L1-like esterase